MITFAVPLNELKPGRSDFGLNCGKEFFESFENPEVLDSDVEALAIINKSGTYIGIDMEIKGSVTVSCDRCLADLKLPVDVSPKFSIKFTEDDSADDPGMDGDREIICVRPSDAVLDLGQIVYDYVMLSLPLKRVHPEGECDSATVRYLSEEREAQETSDESPFSALKGLFDRKQ